VLLGSNTYHQNIFRRILKLAPATRRDPLEVAQPTAADQRRAPDGIDATVELLDSAR
jgi:hypothetical protein